MFNELFNAFAGITLPMIALPRFTVRRGEDVRIERIGDVIRVMQGDYILAQLMLASEDCAKVEIKIINGRNIDSVTESINKSAKDEITTDEI